MPKKKGWSQSVLDAVEARKEAHSKPAGVQKIVGEVKPKIMRPISTTEVKDSLTLQKENSALCMLLAGHYGTETGDNTGEVVWGRDEFILTVNKKK